MTLDGMSSAQQDPFGAPRKPRLALMGEFSAGKSTLMNLLLGSAPLPVRVTATRVPPVWVSKGCDAAVRIRTDGTEEPLALDNLADAPMEDTSVIRVSLNADILELCDLFDIPGISDPNMSTDQWSGLMDEIDAVIWCTHATQAWRQSEAAMWDELSLRTNGRNILVVTQFDKLRTDRDRARVLARLKKETAGKFEAIYPIATLDAMQAGEDETLWKESGAAALVEQLVDTLMSMGAMQDLPWPEDREEDPVDDERLAEDLAPPATVESHQEMSEAQLQHAPSQPSPAPLDAAQSEADQDAARVMPRRVVRKPGETVRPSAEELRERRHKLNLASGVPVDEPI